MITSPKVQFGLYNLVIKQDSTPVYTGTLQSLSKVKDLYLDNAVCKPFATYEPDFWLLDGGYKFIPEDTSKTHVGIMSAVISDGNGVFGVQPYLTITFSETHTTDGITLRFGEYSDDYANVIKIEAYDESDNLISEVLYAIDTSEYCTNEAIEDFKKLVITFVSTNKPYRYLRLTGIEYGKLILFDQETIQDAKVIEETNPLSIELPMGTLDLKVVSTDSGFSIIAPQSGYVGLREKQPLTVREIVDGKPVYIGKYFLDTWKNPSEALAQFSAYDWLGILDKTRYLGGLWLSPIILSDLIEEILGSTYIPYDLDPDLEAVEIKGWIPVCTLREALQQIAFVAGAYVTCARTGAVRIIKRELPINSGDYDSTLTSSQKGIDEDLSLKSLVTGCEIIAHTYRANTQTTEVLNDSLSAGTYTILFDAPLHDLSIEGATIADSGANYATIVISVTGTVILTGQQYVDSQKKFGKYLDTNTNGISNILSISNATLVNLSNVNDVLQRFYDYYQQRYLDAVKLFSPTVEVGNVVLADTYSNSQVLGMIEKMTLDLSGGFLASAEITGVKNG